MSDSLNQWSEGDVGRTELKDSTGQTTIYPLYITNVDQLRMRNYPDTKSGILTTLDENSILYYLNEKTDYKESIGKHTGHWIKVKTPDDQYDGWVYGAPFFVQPFLSQKQIDSIENLKKGIVVFEHLGKTQMEDISGAQWDASVPGTRFSGYYTYSIIGKNRVLDGKMMIRARIFDLEKKEVYFVPCSLTIDQGMPMTEVNCF